MNYMTKYFNISFIGIFLFLSGIMLGQANTVLFRFNANHDFSQSVSSTVEAFNLTFSDEVDPIELPARGMNGWGYYAPIRTIFSGSGSYMRSTEKVRVTFAGDHNLSGEVWLNPEAAEMSLFSWNDPALSHGIDLYLDGGNVILERRFFDTTLAAVSNSVLSLNEWHYINWTLSVSNQNVNISIYIDGDLDAEGIYTLSSPVGFAIINTEVQIGKSEFNTGLPYLKGKLSAVNFKSYIPQEEYLNTHIPFDGSEYSGIPAYHNYNIGSSGTEADQRITENSTPIMESVIVPYMDDDFIPQGLTNSEEDDDNTYSNPMVYSSLYNKTISGQTRLKRSIVVEMDPNNNYKIRRCFQLAGELKNSHVGGIAFFNNRVYVASSYKIEAYTIPEFDTTNGYEKYVNLNAQSNMLFNVASQASFVTYFRDTIWVGDYRTSTDAFLFGYPLNEDGSVDVASTPKKYFMPLKTQGVAWTTVSGTDYLMISTSGGDGKSYIYRVPRSNLSSNQYPVEDRTLAFPAGGEDLSFDNDQNLYAQSESGAKHFQKRSSPWSTFYPFLFKISYDTMFDDLTSVEEHDSQSSIEQNKIKISSYPNPANGQIQIQLNVNSNSESELRIVDVLGRTVKKWLPIQPGNRSMKFLWSDSNAASGIYFLQLISNGKIHSHKMILMK
jgi:hypothetical protein